MFSNLNIMWTVMLTSNKTTCEQLRYRVVQPIFMALLTPIEQCHNSFRHENICPRQTINDMDPHTKLQS